MDEEYHCGILNRLPVYYGGDLYDTKDMDEFDPDVQERMDFVNYAHSRPDDGKTRGVDTVDMVYMCRTASGDEPGAQDEPDRSLEMDASHIEELYITGLGRCPEFGERKDPSVPSDELHVNIGLDMQNRNNCIAIIRIRTPLRSWNITLGMTHAHGNFGVRLGIVRRG